MNKPYIKKWLLIFTFLISLVGIFFVAPKYSYAAGSLTATQVTANKTFATGDDTFASGWKWTYEVTVPDNETKLNMKFSNWTSGANTILAANNTRIYSAQSSDHTITNPIIISAADTYSDIMNLNVDLDGVTAGRQIQIIVQVKAPIGSADGSYSSNYAVYTEAIPLPTLSYTSPNLFTVSTAISTLSPTVTGQVDSYSVSPALPSGLSLNTSNGQIYGIPTAGTTQATYTITATNTGGSTTFGVVIMVNNTVVGAGGKVWLDRNLGATQVALSSTDADAYGSLFQWGRPADGHQLITWINSTTGSGTNGTQLSQVANVAPGTNIFITSGGDWSSIDGTGATRSSNWAICPAGFRVPTKEELSIESKSWSTNNATGAFASSLKLTTPGHRDVNINTLNSVGVYGWYWSDSVNGGNSWYWSGDTGNMTSFHRGFGFSVRCTANSYAVSYNANGSNGGAVPANQSKTSDVALVLRTNSGTIVKTGYTFSGWNTSADGSGTTYAVGGNYTVNDSVVLYAKWTPIQTTPTFNPVAGVIAFGTTVTITSAGADAIYYTTDGSDPTISSINQAATPLVINSAVTVKALAIKAGYDNSAIGSATYTQASLAIGDSSRGGIVAYVLQSGDPGYNASVQHGFIVAPSDQSASQQWSNVTNLLIGTTGLILGTGQANTTAIISQPGHTASAAKLCNDLSLSGNGDWYLPSRDELGKLYPLKALGLAGFSGLTTPYWSSSESWFSGEPTNQAGLMYFSSGAIGTIYKNNSYHVRCISSF